MLQLLLDVWIYLKVAVSSGFYTDLPGYLKIPFINLWVPIYSNILCNLRIFSLLIMLTFSGFLIFQSGFPLMVFSEGCPDLIWLSISPQFSVLGVNFQVYQLCDLSSLIVYSEFVS